MLGRKLRFSGYGLRKLAKYWMRELWCERKVTCGHDIVIYWLLAGLWLYDAFPGRPDWQTYMQKFLHAYLVFT